MGIFGDEGTKNELMRKPVTLDEILEEEKRIIESNRATKEAAFKGTERHRGHTRSHGISNRNPYDAHAAPSYAPDQRPRREEPEYVSQRRRSITPQQTPSSFPAAPKDEFEAAALAAYYSTYSKAFQSRRNYHNSDAPYSSSEYTGRRSHPTNYRSRINGDRRTDYGRGRASTEDAGYSYRTGVENETPSRIPPRRITPSIPSASSPQFLPDMLGGLTSGKDNDAEVVCLGERVSGEVPPPPKIKSNVPILIVDDDEAETVSMVDT